MRLYHFLAAALFGVLLWVGAPQGAFAFGHNSVMPRDMTRQALLAAMSPQQQAQHSALLAQLAGLSGQAAPYAALQEGAPALESAAYVGLRADYDAALVRLAAAIHRPEMTAWQTMPGEVAHEALPVVLLFHDLLPALPAAVLAENPLLAQFASKITKLQRELQGEDVFAIAANKSHPLHYTHVHLITDLTVMGAYTLGTPAMAPVVEKHNLAALVMTLTSADQGICAPRG